MEDEAEALLLRLVGLEHLREELRPEVRQRRADRHARTDPAEREELDREAGRRERLAQRRHALLGGAARLAGRREPRDVTLDVGDEDTRAGGRELFGQALQRLRLARPRRARDQAMTVHHRQRYLHHSVAVDLAVEHAAPEVDHRPRRPISLCDGRDEVGGHVGDAIRPRRARRRHARQTRAPRRRGRRPKRAEGERAVAERGARLVAAPALPAQHGELVAVSRGLAKSGSGDPYDAATAAGSTTGVPSRGPPCAHGGGRLARRIPGGRHQARARGWRAARAAAGAGLRRRDVHPRAPGGAAGCAVMRGMLSAMAGFGVFCVLVTVLVDWPGPRRRSPPLRPPCDARLGNDPEDGVAAGRGDWQRAVVLVSERRRSAMLGARTRRQSRSGAGAHLRGPSRMSAGARAPGG